MRVLIIRRVLLVDDESPELDGLTQLMPWEEFGLVLVGATTSPIEALEMIAREQVDLLISDIRMPRMSGLDLFARAKEYNPAIVAVFISGHADFAFAKRAIEENAAAYVLKPLDHDELGATLREVVHRMGPARELSPPERSDSGQDDGPRDRLLIRDVKRVVDEEMDRGVSLKELAHRFGVTPNHLGHVFRHATGESFSTFITRRRLERAKILLKDPVFRIYEVADKLGYSSISHFCRVFKNRYGVSPGEFRDGAPVDR